jgi:D-alanyl-D-alanine carboxypeptidase (penicillin-binding protein 5/6)
MIRYFSSFLFKVSFSIIGIFFLSKVEALELNSKQAILIDTTTGTVLFEKNPDEKVAPSSMSKMMTVYLAFEQLKSGALSPDKTFMVSEKAWRKDGSKMFLPVGASVKVMDLLRGVVVQSGNDAAIALAEGIGGTEEDFAALMTQKAHEIGAVNSVFKNASGWPDPEHLTTVRDLAMIAHRTIHDFPEYYALYKEIEFTYNNIRQMNRNPLLYNNLGADGLKTGHTDAGGYGLTASTVQEGRRLIMVINGAESMKTRAEDSKALITWGYSFFASPCLYKMGEVVDHADVWLGQQEKIPLKVAKDIYVTLPRQDLKNLKAEIHYKNPLPAPIREGQEVGKVVVTGISSGLEVPLIAGASIEKAGIFSRIGAVFHYLFWGHN